MATIPIIRLLLDLVFPPSCLLCAEPTFNEASLICQLCRVGIEQEVAQPTCPTCGSNVAAYQILDGKCPICRRYSTRISGTVRVGSYSGLLGHAFRGYKFRNQWSGESTLSALLVERVAAASWVGNLDAVVAVPTYWMRRMARNVYPADAFASIIAKRLHIPQAPVLRRIRGGRHQIGLSYTQRLANVKGAFALRRGARLYDARILLVDDVKTTGATLNECAKILRKNGAAEVYAAVLLQAGWQPGSVKYLDVV